MIDSSKLIFQDFQDKREINCPGFTVGQLGPLKLATDPETGQKYIVKHTYPHNAANEYAAMWLAEKMSVPTPRAFLLSPCKCLNSDYAVAIEYIEGLSGFDKATVQETLHNELIGQFTLSLLVFPDDFLQMGCANGHIYSYDYSEGFCVVSSSLLNACLQSEDACVASIIKHIREFKQHLSYIDFDIPGLAREFHIDPNKLKQGMIAAAKKVTDISKDEINAMSEEIGLIYPVGYDVYYEKCIEAIQEMMKQY